MVLTFFVSRWVELEAPIEICGKILLMSFPPLNLSIVWWGKEGNIRASRRIGGRGIDPMLLISSFLSFIFLKNSCGGSFFSLLEELRVH